MRSIDQIRGRVPAPTGGVVPALAAGLAATGVVPALAAGLAATGVVPMLAAGLAATRVVPALVAGLAATRFLPALVAGLAGLTVAASAPAKPRQVGDNAWFEQVPQGPALLMIPQHSVPMVSCTVLVPAGSAFENGTTSGAAHYLEHLLFNGTTRRTREEIYAETDRLGAYNNASTQRERTVFQLLLPSEQWRRGLDLQADMILHSTLPADMFEKEKGILLAELAKDRGDPAYDAGRFEATCLWGETGRGLPVLGTESSIRDMDPADVAAFYHANYRAAGMIVLLMGDFSPDDARAHMASLYGTSEPPLPVPPRPSFPDGRTIRSHPFDELPSTRIRIQMPLPEIAAQEYAGVRVLESLLNDGETTALRTALAEHGVSPLSVAVGVDAGAPWSLLTISVDLPLPESPDASGGAESVTGLVLEHLASLLEPPTRWERWRRAVGLRPRGDPARADDFRAAARALRVDEISLREKMHYYGLFRADVLGGAGPVAAMELLDHADSAGDVALRLLRSALTDPRLLVTVAGPGIPEESRPAPAAPAVPDRDVPAPAHDVAAASDEWSRVTTSSVTRTVLDNGLTVIVHASPDSRTFAAHVLLRDRSSLEEARGVPRGTSDVVHRMMELGTAASTEPELRGRLSALGAKLKVTDSAWIPYDDYYFSPEYSYARLETIDRYGVAALDLLGEVIRTPRFTEANLAKAVEGAESRAATDARSTREAATTTFLRSVWPSHPLGAGVYGEVGSLASLTLDEARDHHQAMVDPTRLTLVVSSDLDPETLLGAVRRSFGWESAASTPDSSVTTGPVLPPARSLVELDQEQSWIVLGSPLVDVPAEDGPALELAVSILSDRLADRLREREGLAYSIGAALRLSGPGPAVMMSAGTRPENLDRMEAGMLEVARTLVSAPPTPDALDAARNRREGRLRMRRLTRMGQAFALAMADYRGQDPEQLDANLPALNAVTPDDVVRVAKRWLTFETPSVAIAR